MSTTGHTTQIVQEMYAAAAGGDIPRLRELLADDVVINEPPALPYGGRYTGFDAFVGCFGQAMAVIDLTRLRLDSLTVENADAFGCVTVPLASGDGEARIIEHWTVRDGKVVTGDVFWFDTTIVPTATHAVESD
jgi:ketosteroid isomerase-like protein